MEPIRANLKLEILAATLAMQVTTVTHLKMDNIFFFTNHHMHDRQPWIEKIVRNPGVVEMSCVEI